MLENYTTMKIVFILLIFLFGSYSLNAQRTKTRCLSGDCKNGEGVIEYAKTGTTLEAVFTNGKFNQGTLRFKNGDVYQGYFRQELFDSLGYFYHHSANEYKVGFFLKDSLMRGYLFAGNKVKEVKDKVVTQKKENINLSPALSDGRIAGHCITGDCKNGVSIWLFTDGTQLKYDTKQGEYSNAQLEWTNRAYYSGELNSLIPHGLGFLHADSLNWEIGEFRNGKLVAGFKCENGTLSEHKRTLSPDELKKAERIKEILEQKKNK